MGNIEAISQSDRIFFHKMVSSFDPISGKPQFYNRKNYYKILDEKESGEFKRFIRIYNTIKHVLRDRQRQILDDLYGENEPRITMKEAGKIHQITQERVRQVRVQAERKLKYYLQELSNEDDIK